ncbi:Acyl-CoA synthetase family member 2 [Venturia nashicola]|nr:Acyl-CoA synthetase family member 2 [Venturia nashicola]
MAESLSEVYGDPLPSNIPSLWEGFSSAAKSYPENIALVATHQPPNLFGITSQPLEDEQYQKKPYLRWTYKEFKNAVERTKCGLQTLGIHEEMPVLTFANNCAEYFLVLQAVNPLGAVLAPINPRNLANKEEITHMIKVIMSSCPGQRAVIVVQDANIARQIDALPISEGAIKIMLQAETGTSIPLSDKPSRPDSWIPFEEVMAGSKAQSTTNGHVVYASQDQSIFFTSGTTSLPKGVRMPVGHTSSFLEMRGFRRDVDAGDKWCIVVPNNHVMAYNVANACFNAGAALVLAGSAFVPTIMMDTLFREQCTHATLVPTMLHALIGIKAAQGQKLNYLKHVMFGGSLLTPAMLKSCVEELGADAVENAYGMTEGTIISTGKQSNPIAMIRGDDVSVGSVLVGTGIKCCLPGETTPVPRKIPGEIHFHRESLPNYIGMDSDDFYNDDQGRRWFKTGDQGVLDHDGRVFLVGRYKDMIIRGGENISPAAIETAIGLMPQMKGVLVQVVAAPDDIAGEVPVAVIQGEVTPELIQGVQDAVIRSMGTIYVPDDVISLNQLGLVDYPRTMAGKIQKTKLAALVRKYRSDQNAVMTNGTDSQLESDVKNIWAKAIGIPLTNLRVDDPLAEVADSITVMRVRDKIKRQTGKTLSLAEMAESGTIAGHIKLLKSQPVADFKETTHHRVIRQGPPGVEDMAHLTEDPELFEPTKAAVSKALAVHGLEWDDVEDVMPAYDFANVMAEVGEFDSWGFKFALMSRNQLRTAIETMLKNNRILASFLVSDKEALESDLALHVAIRQDKKLFDIVIQDEGSVTTVEELAAIPLKYPYPQHALFPGPLFRALIYYVEETKSAAVITNVSHAVIDASYSQIYSEDFDRALAGSTKLHEHLDYKIWADSYYSLRTSPEARAGTKWHLKRLKNITSHKKALWPQTPTRSKYKPTVQDPSDGYQTSFEAPNMPTLRKSHQNLTAIIVLKAALALLNTHKTGHTHALFSNLEAARTTFPFLPKSLQESGKWEATDVAGPTISSVINLIPIPDPSEPVLAFLTRLQVDQENLTKYASTPWREMMASLGPEGGALLPRITTTQIFNWTDGWVGC